MNICVEYKKYNVGAGITVRWLTEQREPRIRGDRPGKERKVQRCGNIVDCRLSPANVAQS